MAKKEDGLVRSENVVMGIVGALIGALAGVVVIILLDLLGFIASLAGVIMGYATLYMYEKLAGTISKKGVIICVIVMIAMVLLGENLAWSIAISKQTTLSIKDVFFNFYPLIQAADVVGTYIGNLAMLYLFTALGAFGIIKSKLELIKSNN